MQAASHPITATLLATLSLAALICTGCETIDPGPPRDPGWGGGGGYGGGHQPDGGYYTGADPVARVRGTLYVRGGAPPHRATGLVRIVSLNRGGRRAILAEQQLGRLRGSTIPFEVFFDPRRVHPSEVYNLEAFIFDRGQTLFEPEGQLHVITHDNPTDGIAMLVVPVRGSHGGRPPLVGEGGGGNVSPPDRRPPDRRPPDRRPPQQEPPPRQPPPRHPPPGDLGGRPDRPLVLPRELTGTLSSPQRVQLQGSSRLVVELRNAAGVAISSQTYTTGSLPMKFSLPVPGRQIDPAARYHVSARLEGYGRTLMQSPSVSVLTRGHPTSDVVLNLRQ
jgi:uncharacterized lipoprotein YbaY